jgi:hypothetical protein
MSSTQYDVSLLHRKILELQTALEQVVSTCGMPSVHNGTNVDAVSLPEEMAPSGILTNPSDESPLPLRAIPDPLEEITINSDEEMNISPDEPSSTVDVGTESPKEKRKTRVFSKRNYNKVTAVNSKMVYDAFHNSNRERGQNIDAKFRISLATEYNLSHTGVQGILNEASREKIFCKHLAIIRCYNNGMTIPQLQVKFPGMLQGNTSSVVQFETFEAIVNTAAQMALFASVRAVHDKEHRLSEEKIDEIQAYKWFDHVSEPTA